MQTLNNFMLLFGSIACLSMTIACVALVYKRHHSYLQYMNKVRELQRALTDHPELQIQLYDMIVVTNRGLHNATENVRAALILMVVSFFCNGIMLAQTI